MAKNSKRIKPPYGYATRIAEKYGCSPSLVKAVAAGKRKNARIELLILEEIKEAKRLKQKIYKLRSTL